MASTIIDGESLDVAAVVAIAGDPAATVRLSDDARARCEASHATIARIVGSGRAVYGVNTGFGDLARVRIDDAKLAQLQRNLIVSHSVGVGRPFDDEIVRAILLLRANTLAKGHSGVRVALIELLLAMLERGVLPVIPELGSLGASGDLAPLAHMSLVLIGEGRARFGGEEMDGAQALARAGLAPTTLGPKEGLALINGTNVMTALACFSLVRAYNLLRAATIIAGLSTEALRGTDSAFSEALARLRPHPGHLTVAAYLRAILGGSEVIQSHRDCPKVQDPYSIRCIPQVHGACLDAWRHCRGIVQIEVNSATDNPLVVGEQVLTGGNFHGEPIGFAMDYLSVALAELGSISERRSARLMDAKLSDLPPFLTRQGGLHSGLMVSHYTAASLVCENRILCHPATVDSLPTSADQEDHVSMATTAARKTFTIMMNLADILAIELINSGQGLEFLRPLKCGRGTEPAYRLLREHVRPLEEDRVITGDLAKARGLILRGELAARVESAAGASMEEGSR